MKKEKPSLRWEGSLWQQQVVRIAGVDEVGRGAIAGGVLAAAVILPMTLNPEVLSGVRDSKQLSAKQRQYWAEQIRRYAVAIGVGGATVAEIDRLNIRRATALAMHRALDSMAPVEHVLVDGLAVPELLQPQTNIIKGDQSCLSIAAASIIAKVARDHAMQRLGHRFPQYGWGTNVGYGTAAHYQGLQQWGLTRHHRRSFLRAFQDSTQEKPAVTGDQEQLSVC